MTIRDLANILQKQEDQDAPVLILSVDFSADTFTEVMEAEGMFGKEDENRFDESDWVTSYYQQDGFRPVFVLR